MLRQDFYRHNGRPEDPNVAETTLMSDILDNFSRVRFRVSMTDMWDLVEGADPEGNRYLVEVIDVQDPNQAATVLKEWRRYREDAVRYYRECVSKYRSLVVAETSHMQDMDLRGPRVNYRKCEPECCASCRFSHPVGKTNALFDEWRRNRGKFLCRHPDVVKPDRPNFAYPKPVPGHENRPPEHNPCPDSHFDFNGDHDHDCGHEHLMPRNAPCEGMEREHSPGEPTHECHSERHPPVRPPRHMEPMRAPALIDVCPIVEADGVCDKYEPSLDQRYRNPAHSRRAFEEHDSVGGNRIDQIVRYEVQNAQRNVMIDANAEYPEPGLKTRFEHKIDERIEEFLDNHPVDLIDADSRRPADPDYYEQDHEHNNTVVPGEDEFVYGGGGAN